MSIVKSSKDKDQLVMDIVIVAPNKSQVIWRCCKNNCVCCLRFDGIEYVKVIDHVHAPNPEEFVSIEFKSIINTGAMTSRDPSRRIIHGALLYINKNVCTLNGQELFFIFDTYLLNLLN